MIKIINTSCDPYFNLALEEYVVTAMPAEDGYFFLWQNDPTIVVGRNQNTIEEINLSFVDRMGINVARRMSGGGAVYHDCGNLNYTFVVQEDGRFHQFDTFTNHLINTLAQLGIEAVNSGRNDVTIEGRKFSGNAQFKRGNRLLHHGTILFNSDLDIMTEALNVKPDKVVSKGIKSVRSRVTNIKEHLSMPMEINEFKALLCNNVMSASDENLTYYLTQTDFRAVIELRRSKYATWDWIFGSSPSYTIRKTGSFSWGNVEFLLNIKQGYIQGCKVYGDFFADQDIDELGKRLIGLAYQKDTLRKSITPELITSYWPLAKADELLEALL